MYSTVQEIRLMLKEHVLETFMSNDFFDISEDLQKEAILIQVVEDAISDADSEVDGYLSKRYPTPLSVVPGVINKISKDIAIYNIASRSGMKSDERENNYYVRYKNAIKYLENLAKGIVNLPDSNSSEEQSETKTSMHSDFQIRSSEKIFGRSNMGGY